MNRELMQARSKMRGQKAKLDAGGFDNSPVPEGRYACKVAQSEVRTREIEATPVPVHYTRLSITVGPLSGKSLFPFGPRLDELDGVTQCATNIQRILGDVVPGRNVGVDFELDVDKFLGQVEDLAAKCVGEVVEVTVKNSRSKRDDGTPWQNVYINRGLGADKAGVPAGGKGKDKPEVNPPDKVPGGKPTRRVKKGDDNLPF